jgi:hypothetical protein
MCGYLKLLPRFLMVVPGMISRMFFPGDFPKYAVIGFTERIGEFDLLGSLTGKQAHSKKN